MSSMRDTFQRQSNVVSRSMSQLITGATNSLSYVSMRDGDKKSIDFKRLMDDYRKRTEINMPYSMMKVEDAMFVNKKQMVALEYIFYDTDQGDIVPMYHQLHEAQGQTSLLGLEDYKCDPNKCPMNAFEPNAEENQGFKRKIKHLSFDPTSDYFKDKPELRVNGHIVSHDLNQQSGYQSGFVVEQIISLWNIDKQGNMVKKLQRSFQSDHEFEQSRDGKRMLTLSQDKSIVTLGIMDSNNQFSLKAWSVQGLNEYPFNPKLLENLEKSVKIAERKYESITLVCKSQYLMLIQKSQADSKAEKEEFMVYSFFQVSNGQLVLEFSNNPKQDYAIKQNIQESERAGFRSLGVLVPEKKSEEDENPKLSFVFFFAAPSTDQTSQTWEISLTEITLDEIHSQSQANVFDFIMSKGWGNQESSKDFEKFLLPKSWFLEEKQFNSETMIKEEAVNLSFKRIQIGANKTFTDFGFLHSGQYQAFMNRHQIGKKLGTYSGEIDELKTQPDQPVKEFLQDSEIGSITRNQQCKKFLFLMIRVKNGGSQAICFLPEKKARKNIRFKKDHLHARHDVQTQQAYVRAEEREGIAQSDKYMLQSCSISDTDQQILLKTQKIQSQDLQDIKSVQRKSINQRHSGHYPIFAYNLGLKKLMIQNTQEENRNFIYELPGQETFVSFIEYKKFEDIGFYPSNLKVEMCSNFVFLSKQGSQTFVNVLLVDPYHTPVQFAILQSLWSFDSESGLDMHKDTIIKSLMYSTKKKADQPTFEIKLLTQYTESFTQEELQLNWRHDGNDESSPEESSDESSDCEHKHEVKESDQSLEPVPIIMSPQGFMYYVIGIEGNCIVKQINPASDYIDDHLSVLEVKSEFCLGFCTRNGEDFYFVDQNRNISKHARNPETKGLAEVERLIVKDKDIHSLEIGRFANLIIEDKYLISQSRIFYLNSQDPLINGILDMEDLSRQEQEDESDLQEFEVQKLGARSIVSHLVHERKAPNQRKCVDGPFRLRGSSQFLLAFQSGQSQNFNQRVYKLPDSSSASLVNDQERRAEFSTFLDKNRILLQVAVPGPMGKIKGKEMHLADVARFAVFTEDGKFLSSVEFLEHNEAKQEIKIQKSNPEKQENTISKSCQMHFVAMSNSNKYFLFLDLKTRTHTVYTLTQTNPGQNRKSLYRSHRFEDGMASDTSHYFKPEYKLNMEPFITSKQIDQMLKPQSLGKESCPWDITITDEGRVMLLTHEEAEFSSKSHVLDTDQTSDESGELINYNVKGVIFSCQTDRQENGMAKGQSFERRGASFNRAAVEEIHASIKKAKISLERQRRAELLAQSQLPRNFRDETRLQDLERQLREEDRREETIVHQYIFGDLLVVFCGRHIKYTELSMESLERGEPVRQGEWMRAAVDFDRGVDIEKIYETSKRNWLQIIARETVRNVLIVLTWDFEENMEASMFQLNCLPGTVPENYVARGLNQKLNYFVDQHQIYDLELNIPCQESTNNWEMVKGIPTQYAESRQIYCDASRALCINHANLLNFPLTRMDLILWKSISELGEQPQHIKSNTELLQFNQRFDENSLFHYFASNIQVVEMLHKRFKDAKHNNQLTRADENAPLIMLYPNRAKKTALDIALDAQVPKAFELLVDLLEPFDSVFISKMLLNCLPFMVSMSSEYILRFFATCVYRSSMMEVGCYPWDDHWAQINFTCHTTFVSPEIIRGAIQRQRYSFNSLWKRWGKTGRKSIQNEEPTQNEEPLPSQLADQAADAPGEIYKRIKVEAIDLDWIFQHENTKNFIMLLAQCEQSEIFLQKSIRVFVEIIWEQYQPAIIKAIFLPYCVYLLLLVSLTSKYAGEFLDLMIEPEQQAGERRDGLFVLEGLSGTCALLLGYFMWIEFRQLCEEKAKIRYFQDYWNYFDLASVALNFIFLVMLFQGVLYEVDYSREVVKQVRLVGALAVFIMWIKIFYWMRLFRIFAHFISLLSQTARDISTFTVMLLLILAAFANFFYIINNNTPGGNADYREADGPSFHYVDRYVHNPVVDSLIAVYLMCLGEFDVQGYSQGPNQYAAWVAFVLATFIVLVVFMNIVIAIMTESFNKVEQTKEQLQLEEQLQLVKDYIWLLDMKKVFKGKKYIMRLTPDMSSHTESENVFDQVQELTKEIIKKSEKTKDQVYENNEVLEKQIRNQINQFKDRLSVMLDQVFMASNPNAENKHIH